MKEGNEATLDYKKTNETSWKRLHSLTFVRCDAQNLLHSTSKIQSGEEVFVANGVFSGWFGKYILSQGRTAVVLFSEGKHQPLKEYCYLLKPNMPSEYYQPIDINGTAKILENASISDLKNIIRSSKRTDDIANIVTEISQEVVFSELQNNLSMLDIKK